jgi:transposase
MEQATVSDPMKALFSAALGMEAPWRVEAIRFEPETQTVHFDLICEATRLPCPACGAADQPIHDRQRRDWQHLHFFQYRALLHAEVPRVRCLRCGERGDPEVKQVAVPWARERSGFSLLFEAMIVTLAGMSKLPIRQIAALLGVSEGRLWRSLGALVDDAYVLADMSQVKAVGVDEKHVGRGRVVTVVHEAEGPCRVLHLSEGAKADNVAQFAQALSAHGGDPAAIERCTLDMGKQFIAGAGAFLPRAELCFDPFHIVKLANEAVDAVRREEVGEHPELKRTRYLWLKDASDWSEREVAMHWLRNGSLKTARAWRLKESLREILHGRHRSDVPVVVMLEGWISWARRSRLAPFKRLGATLREHWDGVCNMLRHANSNARAESINADIQATIARARGFRTFRNLRAIVYLLKGGLDLPKSPYART